MGVMRKMGLRLFGVVLCLGFIPFVGSFQTDWECSMDVSDEMKKAASTCFDKHPIKIHNETEYFKNREGMKFTDEEMNNFICIMVEIKVIDSLETLVFNFDKMSECIDKFESVQKEKDGLKAIVRECNPEVDEVVPKHGKLRIEAILRCFVFKFHQKQPEICGNRTEEKET